MRNGSQSGDSEFTDSIRRHEVFEGDTKKTEHAGTPAVGQRRVEEEAGSGESAALSVNAFSPDPAPPPPTALRALPALESPNTPYFLRVVFETSCLRVKPPRSLRPRMFISRRGCTGHASSSWEASIARSRLFGGLFGRGSTRVDGSHGPDGLAVANITGDRPRRMARA